MTLSWLKYIYIYIPLLSRKVKTINDFPLLFLLKYSLLPLVFIINLKKKISHIYKKISQLLKCSYCLNDFSTLHLMILFNISECIKSFTIFYKCIFVNIFKKLQQLLWLSSLLYDPFFNTKGTNTRNWYVVFKRHFEGF